MAGKRKLQIASAFDLAAKLAILIRHRMDKIPAMIRKSNLYVAADNCRRADVQQLSSDHEAIAPRLRFDLDIDLVGISAVEHLPCSHSPEPPSRQQRLQKTVEQHLDETALLRLLRGSAGCRERRFGDSNSRRGRLIAGFPRRRGANFFATEPLCPCIACNRCPSAAALLPAALEKSRGSRNRSTPP